MQFEVNMYINIYKWTMKLVTKKWLVQKRIVSQLL